MSILMRAKGAEFTQGAPEESGHTAPLSAMEKSPRSRPLLIDQCGVIPTAASMCQMRSRSIDQSWRCGSGPLRLSKHSA